MNGHVWTGSTWLQLLPPQQLQASPYAQGWAPTPQWNPGYYVPAGYPVARVPYNGLAIASFVMSFVWFYGVGSVVAIIMGAFSLAQIRRTGEKGRGLAIAGIVIGGLGIVGIVAFIIILIVSASNPTYGALARSA